MNFIKKLKACLITGLGSMGPNCEPLLTIELVLVSVFLLGGFI